MKNMKKKLIESLKDLDVVDMSIEELEEKAFHDLSIKRVQELMNPFGCWIELESPITIDEVKKCIKNGEAELVETPLYSEYLHSKLSPEEARKNHIKKIAFFALNENTKPISIDVGFPDDSNVNNMYFLDDGNHRLAGRIVAESKTIKAHVMGDVQYLKNLNLWNPNKYQVELDRKYTLQYLDHKKEDYIRLLDILKEKINTNKKIFNREEFHLFHDVLDTYFIYKEEIMELKEEENIIKKLKFEKIPTEKLLTEEFHVEIPERLKFLLTGQDNNKIKKQNKI